MRYYEYLLVVCIVLLTQGCTGEVSLDGEIDFSRDVYVAIIDDKKYYAEVNLYDCIDGFLYLANMPQVAIRGEDMIDDKCWIKIITVPLYAESNIQFYGGL